MKYPPVIIIGMGRSGTSILTQLLSKLGLFVGKKISPATYEALFFQELNKWLLAACGGGLNNPRCISWLLENNQVKTIVTDFIRFVLRTPKVISFLGLKRYLAYGTPEQLRIPWGWKDPRTTFTLPIWLAIFPDAKVVHVHRHGVDVANSLKVRYDGIVSLVRRRREKYGRLYHLFWLMRRLPRRTELFDLRACTLEGGFSLWEEYVAEAKKHVESLGNRAFEVRFEHLMEDPIEVLRSTAAFCELGVSEASLLQVISSLRKERAYAYRSSEELRSFARNVAERLERYGH